MNKNEIELIELLTDKIKNTDNFSYIRFGDAELLCMAGKSTGQTKDKHTYSNKLGSDLMKSFLYFVNNTNVYLGKWDRDFECSKLINSHIQKLGAKNFHSFHILSSELNYINQYQYKFYETIKFSNRKKILIGHEGLSSMMKFLNFDKMIEIPKINAYDQIEDILSKCLNEFDNDSIYVYCAGMNTKILIRDILQKHSNTTHIDVGSAFEPFYNSKTRSKHVDSNLLQTFYKPLLTNV